MTFNDRYRAQARKSEERFRPVTAEITVMTTTKNAVLRFLNSHGRITQDDDLLQLPGTWTYAGGPVEQIAQEFIEARGFRIDGGWSDAETRGADESVTTNIAATPQYLDWVERKTGPVPEIGERPDGISAHRIERGRWALTDRNGRSWEMTWTPKLRCDVWRLIVTDDKGERTIAMDATPAQIMKEAARRSAHAAQNDSART